MMPAQPPFRSRPAPPGPAPVVEAPSPSSDIAPAEDVAAADQAIDDTSAAVPSVEPVTDSEEAPAAQTIASVGAPSGVPETTAAPSALSAAPDMTVVRPASAAPDVAAARVINAGADLAPSAVPPAPSFQPDSIPLTAQPR